MPPILQVHVTKHVLTRIDALGDAPPKYTDKNNNEYAFHVYSPSSFPKTPSAPLPQCTTFSDSISSSSTLDYYSSDSDSDTKSDILDLEIPAGHTIICHPTEPGVYTIARPNTLARLLFFFGFLFPGFWIMGSIILLMPLRPTPDWEAGKSPVQIEWSCEIIRQIELRWARRCLYALSIEITAIVLVSTLLHSHLHL